MELKKIFTKFINNTPFIIFALLSFVLLMTVWTVRLIDTHKNGYILAYVSETEKTSYHSDDVAQSTILWSWQKGFRGGAVVGDDSWYIKYPIYFLSNNIKSSPVKRLFINSWIVLFITALITCLAFLLLLYSQPISNNKKILSMVIAIVLLAFIPPEAFGVIKMPNSRNIELAIFTLLICIMYCYEIRTRIITQHKKIFLTISLILSVMLISDDPLFFYLGLSPLIATVTVMYYLGVINIIKLRFYISYSAISLLAAYLIKYILTIVLPLSYYHHASSIVSFVQFKTNFENLMEKGINIFGIKIFNIQQMNLALLYSLIVLLTNTIIVYFVYKNALRSKTKTVFIYSLSIYLLTFLVYLASGLSGDGAVSSRYLVLLVFLVPFFSIIAINTMKLRRQIYVFVSLVLATAMLSMIFTYNNFNNSSNKASNALSFEVIKLAQENGVSKGVSRFWQANITTYLSDYTQTVLPVACRDGKLVIVNILFDKSRLNKPAVRSYYLYDQNKEVSDCDAQTITNQIGQPNTVKRLETKQNVYMYIYNRDITQQMELTEL